MDRKEGTSGGVGPLSSASTDFDCLRPGQTLKVTPGALYKCADYPGTRQGPSVSPNTGSYFTDKIQKQNMAPTCCLEPYGKIMRQNSKRSRGPCQVPHPPLFVPTEGIYLNEGKWGQEGS